MVQTLNAAMILAATLAMNQRAHSAEATNPTPHEIKAKFHHSRVLLPAEINGRGPLTLLLDTGCTIPTLHPDLIDELKVEPSGRIRIVGIGGEERAPTYRDLIFKIGGASYRPRRVAGIPSEREHDRKWRDGVIGSGFLRNHVVEIIPATQIVKIYAGTNFIYQGAGTEVPLTFREEIPVLKGTLLLGTNLLEAEYELDTGCDSGMCLGSHYVRAHDLSNKLANRSSEKFGVGGSVQTHDTRIPIFKIGNITLKDIQADLFANGSPVDEPAAGHIGMSAFAGRRLILDYPRKRLIIE